HNRHMEPRPRSRWKHRTRGMLRSIWATPWWRPTMRWFVLSLLLAGALHAQTFSDPDFTVDWLATPGYGTIALDFDATGRLYVGQKRGIIHLLTPNAAGSYDMQA